MYKAHSEKQKEEIELNAIDNLSQLLYIASHKLLLIELASQLLYIASHLII